MAELETGAAALRVQASGNDVESFNAIGTVPGIRILYIAGLNGTGVGKLHITSAGLLRWRAPGSETFGDVVDVTVSDTYTLHDGEDPDKFIHVQSYDTFLPAYAVSADVYIEDEYNNLVGRSDIPYPQGGPLTTIFGWTVKNVSLNTVEDIRVWIDSSVSDIWIGEAVGGPWYQPTDEASAIVLDDLAPEATDALYVRRYVTDFTEDPRALTWLHLAFTSFD